MSKSKASREHRWISIQAAADYLGVDERTVRNYIRRGVIEGRRLPSSRMIRVDQYQLDAAMRPIPSARETGIGRDRTEPA